MTLRALSKVPNTRHESGTYDLRNWEARLRRGEDRVGVIDDMLVDEGGRACYLDVALDAEDRHVLVPSGQAEAEAGERVVWLSGLTRDQLSALPAYGHDPSAIDGDFERRLVTIYDRVDTGSDYYDRADYAASWGRGRNLAGSGKLARLDRLDDVDLARGDADPRSWDVVGADGRKLGEVHHLIGDLESKKVRYLTVTIDREITDGKREVLISVGHVELDPGDKQVRLPAFDPGRILTLPVYDGGEITREHEMALTASFNEAYSGERRYHHPRYRYARLRAHDLSEESREAARETSGEAGSTR